MTELYLVDTNIASYLNKGSSAAVQRQLEKVQMTQLAISAVTEGELLYGVARRPEATPLHAVVHEFLLGVGPALGFNVARHYGTLQAALGKQGHQWRHLQRRFGHAEAAGRAAIGLLGQSLRTHRSAPAG